MTIKNIGLIGLGAIGAPLAVALHHLDPEHFYIIAEGKRKERLLQGVMINDRCYHFPILEPLQHKTLDLILVTTKYNQLSTAISDIQNFVGPQTRIIPLLNGITAEEKLAVITWDILLTSTMIAILTASTNYSIKRVSNISFPKTCWYRSGLNTSVMSAKIRSVLSLIFLLEPGMPVTTLMP